MSCALAPGHSMATFTMSTGGGIAAELESTEEKTYSLTFCKSQSTHNVHFILRVVFLLICSEVCRPCEWQHCGRTTCALCGGLLVCEQKSTRHLIEKRWRDQSLPQLSCRIHWVSSSVNTHPHSRHVNPEPSFFLFPLRFNFNNRCLVSPLPLDDALAGCNESLQRRTMEDIKTVPKTSRLPAIFNAFLRKTDLNHTLLQS